MQNLIGLEQIVIVTLEGIGITDNGLYCLKGINKPFDLILHNTSITDNGINNLKQNYPKRLMYRWSDSDADLIKIQ